MTNDRNIRLTFTKREHNVNAIRVNVFMQIYIRRMNGFSNIKLDRSRVITRTSNNISLYYD